MTPNAMSGLGRRPRMGATLTQHLFILADGGRARFVERSSKTGDFVTVDELDHHGALRRLRRELRASPPVRAVDSAGNHRHAVDHKDYSRPAKTAFMAQVADRAAMMVQRRDLDDVVLVAPARLIGVLQGKLARRVPIAGRLCKDLTKLPDHQLAAWLGGARAASPPERAL